MSSSSSSESDSRMQSFSAGDFEFVSIGSPTEKNDDASKSSDAADFKFGKRRDSFPSVKLTLSSDDKSDQSSQKPAAERKGILDKEWRKKHKSEKKSKKEKKKKHHHDKRSKSRSTGDDDMSSSIEIPYLKYAIQEYGTPSVIYTSDKHPEDAFAHWSKHALKKSGHPELQRVEVRARGHEHDFPQRHGDYVYTTIAYKIPDDKLWDVLKLSNSLTYDRLSHELTSRCAGWQTNSAILYLACRMADGHISLQDARDRKVLAKMMSKAARDPKIARRYAEKLAAMIAN